MFKKVVIALLLVAVTLAPVSSVEAKPKGSGILIEDIVYTVKDVPDFIAKRIKGPVLYGEGEGTINCNGVAVCEDAGLHGQTVIIKQAIRPSLELLDFKARTAGRILLPGEYPAINFKGKGKGTAECTDDVCHLTMEFDARTKRGGTIISRIDIDFTSAGWSSQFTGAIIAMQRESK